MKGMRKAGIGMEDISGLVREVFKAKDEIKEAQEKVRQIEYTLKRSLIDSGNIVALDINYSRLRRMNF